MRNAVFERIMNCAGVISSSVPNNGRGVAERAGGDKGRSRPGEGQASKGLCNHVPLEVGGSQSGPLTCTFCKE